MLNTVSIFTESVEKDSVTVGEAVNFSSSEQDTMQAVSNAKNSKNLVFTL